MNQQREAMSDLQAKGTKLQYYCEKKDAIPIKNMLVSIKLRFEKVAGRSVERGKLIDSAMAEAQAFFDGHSEISTWMDESERWLAEHQAHVNGYFHAANMS